MHLVGIRLAIWKRKQIPGALGRWSSGEQRSIHLHQNVRKYIILQLFMHRHFAGNKAISFQTYLIVRVCSPSPSFLSPSAFLLYSQENRPMVKKKNPHLNNTDISRLLGQMWRRAPPEVKEPFQTRAEREGMWMDNTSLWFILCLHVGTHACSSAFKLFLSLSLKYLFLLSLHRCSL